QRILADSASPGHANTYMILEGVALLGDGRSVSFIQLQVAHVGWTAFCGTVIGMIARGLVGLHGALVAQAVFLFSPWAISTAYNPGMNQIAPLCLVVLSLLGLAAVRRRSPAALAAAGAVAGFSGTEPTVVFSALLVCAVIGYATLRQRPIRWPAIVTAAASGVAAILPALPNWATIVDMATTYAFGQHQLGGIVQVLLGQRTTSDVTTLLSAGRPGSWDIPLGALLSPFAITRIPIRLWADTLVDPCGTALMTIGLLWCIGSARSSGLARLLLALLFASLLHGFTAGGDVTSHARVVAAMVPIAILAGLGFVIVSDRLSAPARRSVAGLALLSCIGGGTGLFWWVGPAILPASWQTIALQSLATGASQRAVFLHHGFKWLYVERIATLVPALPHETQTFNHFYRSAATAAGAGAIYLWSPSLEYDSGASCSICERWPDAELFLLYDDSGLSRAYAGVPERGSWRPALPPERWQRARCKPGSVAYPVPALSPPQTTELHCGTSSL
ncbi:MAG TPA: hypothetical protein VEB21_19290, partial [Terriglobales bacterium]|nr:hypothetical protein [Terriglobales bacterium]